jgi:hypothetical protein
MLPFGWNPEKNLKLKKERGVSFDDVVTAINEGDTLFDAPNPKADKYPNQRIFIVKIRNYAYIVPYIENDELIFLKTIYPSRKSTKQYLN